jgi:hypothetical protein
MEMEMSDENSLSSKEWHKTYIDQLGYVINLFLIMATGSIGFCISQLTVHSSHDPAPAIYTVALKVSIGILFVSILAGVACTLVRLLIFLRTGAS